MDKEGLRLLSMLNQLEFTDSQKEDVISFFRERDTETATLTEIDTENVERMVHVMPVLTVVREDVVVKNYTAEQLQQGAPETDQGYWCVPRVLE